jgi:class 3 adenylate cyclase
MVNQRKKQKDNQCDSAKRTLSDVIEQDIPRHMIEALQDGRSVEPKTHECVTVICASISGYDSIVRHVDTGKVKELLAAVHDVFEELCDRLDVFSVDTIVDGSYMFVCNIEGGQPHHASLAAAFAIESILGTSIIQVNTDDPSAGSVQLRLGFHSGPVVSHLIGSKSARFTLIGDTVNTAMALELSSTPGKVHCSRDSFILLSNEEGESEFRVKEHGMVQIKGRDDVFAYWIESALDRVETC